MELDAVGLARTRLSEVAVHTWDLAVALDPRAQIAPEAVELLIDTQGFLVSRVGKAQGHSFRLHVRTTEPERDFALQVGDGVELREWKDGPADGELRIPAEAFLRLIYGRLAPDHTPVVEITGSATLDDLRRIFPGV